MNATNDLKYSSGASREPRSMLEAELAALSSPVELEPNSTPLWKTALESSRPERLSLRQLLQTPLPWRPLAAVAATVIIGLIMISVLASSLGGVRSGSRGVVVERNAAVDQQRFLNSGYAEVPQVDVHARLDSTAGRGGQSPFPDLPGDESRRAATPAAPVPASVAAPGAAAPADAQRYVAHKASIDLLVKGTDVSVAFEKARFVVSEAQGEYVETSSRSGQNEYASATMVLRVVPKRLPEVLDQLRTLGKVASETSGGDDLTDRVVDLDARLRNERRIETELLELVTSRENAPLKEILDLRAELAKVRGTIEAIVSQREHIGRLVGLATVLVTIRADNAPTPVEESLTDYFFKRIEVTFGRATRSLADSVAWIIGAAIAGAIWWLLIAGVVVALCVARRRWARRSLSEPAPALET